MLTKQEEQEIFDQFDEDGSGELDYEEVAKFISMLGIVPLRKVVKEAFHFATPCCSEPARGLHMQKVLKELLKRGALVLEDNRCTEGIPSVNLADWEPEGLMWEEHPMPSRLGVRRMLDEHSYATLVAIVVDQRHGSRLATHSSAGRNV